MTREEAIEYLHKLFMQADITDAYGDMDDTEPYEIAIDMAVKALQEQKTGKWIIFPPCFEEICMCSNCKTKFKEAYQHRDTCPSCGARME